MLSEISWSQKDKYCMIPLICGKKSSQIHKSAMVVSRSYGEEEMPNKNFWQSRVTDQLSLIYPALRNMKISWLTTQGLFLAHTAYLQHAVHMAKGKKKQWLNQDIAYHFHSHSTLLETSLMNKPSIKGQEVYSPKGRGI